MLWIYKTSLFPNYIWFYNSCTKEHLLFVSSGKNYSIQILPLKDFQLLKSVSYQIIQVWLVFFIYTIQCFFFCSWKLLGMKKPLFIKWSHTKDFRLVVKCQTLEMGKILSWILKTTKWVAQLQNRFCISLARKENVYSSPLRRASTPLRLHTIEMILTMGLAHVFLVSSYEWKIHNYLFQKTSLFVSQKASLFSSRITRIAFKSYISLCALDHEWLWTLTKKAKRLLCTMESPR